MENEKNLEALQEETVIAPETAPAEVPEAEDNLPAPEVSEEAAPAPEAQTAASEEEAAEEAVPSEEKPEEKKVTPGRLALLIGAIVVVAAVIIALLGGSRLTKAPEETQSDPTEAVTEPVATIPADGNPDDETCKGSYSVSDEQVLANRDTVVATIGEHTLTNGQLQVLYWMQVQSFMASEYGSYMMYYGVLDYSQPLDTQICAMTGSGTWQQFFLKEALNTWQNYCALADKALKAGMELTEADREFLNNIEANLASSAQYYGLTTAEELLKYNVGAGAGLKEYTAFQELLMQGNLYYDAENAKLTITEEELETFFVQHEADYAESGITKDGRYVDVRHILFTPEGGTTDESGAVTYSEEEWAACAAKAEEALKEWEAGEKTENSFAALANEKSMDPGSNTNGGLYEDVYEGQMVAEFEQWCFDESRQTGDTGIVKTTYGHHVMYYVGSSPIWETYARQDLMSEKVNAMMLALVAEYPMEVDYSAISLGYVDMAA